MARLILITEHVDADAIALLRRRPGFDVVAGEGMPASALARCEAIGIRVCRLDAATLALAPHLRVVAKHGVGTDNIDVDHCTARGIPVLNTPDANKAAVAEHAFALMLALAKRLLELDAAVRRGDWAIRDRLRFNELASMTLAIIGFGRSGQELARRARAFDMRVVAFGRSLDRQALTALGVEPADSLAAALGEGDVVSLHVPRPSSGVPLIGRAELRAMKRGALLVNCARGGVVDERALADVLDEGHLGGAGIDVLGEEPPPTTLPLLNRANVILTPHIAGSTREASRRMGMEMAENILQALDGRLPSASLVNPVVLTR
ncbi:MAG: hydroxyacid dehydrogenase [Hyphomicrobiaceae bacterium]